MVMKVRRRYSRQRAGLDDRKFKKRPILTLFGALRLDCGCSRTEKTLPENEYTVLSSLVRNDTGPCNFNYKLRPNGSLAIFECNIRVGCDIKDAPADMAERFLMKIRDRALTEARNARNHPPPVSVSSPPQTFPGTAIPTARNSDKLEIVDVTSL